MAVMTSNAIQKQLKTLRPKVSRHFTKIGKYNISPNYEPITVIKEYETLANNIYLADYFFEQSKFAQNTFQKKNYEKVAQLLIDSYFSDLYIESKEDFNELLCVYGDFKNPQGILAHYEYATQII